MPSNVFTFSTFSEFQDAARNGLGGLFPSGGGKYKLHILHKDGNSAKILYAMISYTTGVFNVCKYKPIDDDEVPTTDSWITGPDSGFANNGASKPIENIEIDQF